MIDLLNRIGFRQIAFGGEGGGGGGGGGGGSSDDRREARKKTGQANLAAGKYTGIQSYGGGGGNNDNDGPSAAEKAATAAAKAAADLAAANAARDKAALEAKAVADAEQAAIDAAAYDPYEDASLYDAGGYVQSYSGPDYGGGGGQSDEDTVMSQPVTYTAPDPVTYTAPDPVTSTLTATSPTDTSNLYDFYDFNDNNDEETVMSQPVTYTGPAFETNFGTDPVVDYSLDDLDLGTGVYDPDPVDETPISVFDADMLSQVTRGLGTSTTLGEDNPQLAYANPNSRFDFDPVGAYETEIIPETIGALPSSDIVAGGLGVSPVPKPRPDNLVMGTSPIRPTVTVSTKNALTTPQTFGALPDGVTQQMITDSQNDGEYGYYNNDGSFVPASIDKYNGGGPDYSGVAFASGGGAQFDLDGDRFLSKTEMRIGEEAGKELDENFWSKAGTGLGVTPLGSGQEPTGVAKWAEILLVPGGSTLRKLSPPAFERPLSSYDPNNPYADVGEDAPNIWWEKGKTNPIGFEYKRTPDEVLADRTASREKAAIDDLAEQRQNNSDERDNAPRTRREDLFGTRMTTEEYRRRYKGGGGAALPAYMRKYASGKSIDELVRKVKVNGKDYFLTPDGRYIEPSAFTGAAVARDIDVVETGEEQYLEGYNVIDESTGIITTYNTDGSIMEVFDPNFESEEA
jgi:hypothetical protein